ncbi:MAG: hypothetical protein ACI843_002607 [Psychrobacter glaciei]|jgi:hypothetical protein
MIIFGKIITTQDINTAVMKVVIFIAYSAIMYRIFNGSVGVCAPRQWSNCVAVTAEEHPAIFITLSVIAISPVLYLYYLFSIKDPLSENNIK